MRVRHSTIASSSGRAPPESEVPAPARHDLDVVLLAEAQDRAHLLGTLGQHDGKRQAAIGGERVGLEGAAPFLIGDQDRAGSNLLQLLQNVVPALQDREIRARQGDMRHQGSERVRNSAFKEISRP